MDYNLDQIWDDMKNGIERIYTCQRQRLKKNELMELYTHVFNYCSTTSEVSEMQFIGYELYLRIKEFLQNHVMNLLKDSAGLTEDQILQFFTKQWEEYMFSSKVLKRTCFYLERQFTERCANDTNNIYGIYQLALIMWRDCIFTFLHAEVTSVVLKLIEKERKGVIINNGLIRRALDCYVELEHCESKSLAKKQAFTLYREKFENEFVKKTECFYMIESTEFLRQNPLTEYMKKVEQILLEEQTRVQLYLHHSTSDVLLNTCKKVFIEQHMEMFCTEFRNLLDNDKNEDLGRMFRLVSYTSNGLVELRNMLKDYIYTQGLLAIEKYCEIALNDPKVYVNTILDVYHKYNALIITEFNNEEGFVFALDKLQTARRV